MASVTAKNTQAASASAEHNRFETLAWRFMRWSGVLILPLAFGHLAIMHIINSVYVIDYEWVITERWARVGWRLYDAGLLWFAGLHGFNGLRVVINDYVHSKSLGQMLKMISALVLIFVFALGTIALVGAPLRPVELEESSRILLSLL